MSELLAKKKNWGPVRLRCLKLSQKRATKIAVLSKEAQEYVLISEWKWMVTNQTLPYCYYNNKPIGLPIMKYIYYKGGKLVFYFPKYGGTLA